jgi:hypothetical protein
MGTLTLNWDNTAVNASSNATGQRASKRIKSVGGAFQTSGFTPTNDMAKSVNEADATVTDNRVYEFKIEALCLTGGPIANTGGLKEGIVFACIVPSFTVSESTIQVVLNVLNTDISKARIILKKQSDDSTVGTITPNTVSNTITANFTGLDASTDYYVTIELYATVGGVEVISSDENYLNDVCGGDVEGYQVSTNSAPSCPAPTTLTVSN